VPIERCQRKQDGEVQTPVVKKSKEGATAIAVMPTRLPRTRNSHTSNCIVCHGAAATGKMGRTMVVKDVVYKQVLTDPGMFAIIHSGASGAMRSFYRRGMMKCSGSSPM
jgi:cytochrome c-L